MENEQPFDWIVSGFSNTAIFRRIAFIGDTHSSGEFEALYDGGSRTYHEIYDYSWGQFVARQYGLNAYNFSRSGMSATEYIESFADEQDYWNLEKACQAYVIAMGVNDIIGQGQPVGELADIDLLDYKNNKHTFMGYYAPIIARYKQIHPEAEFFLLTIP